MKDTSSAEFFEAKYRADADPWNFATSAYEQQRYDAIFAALNGRRYRHALEPACSVGVLTERLATLCDTLEACDLSQTAVAAAQQRCARFPGATVWCRAFSADEAWNTFDLVTLCEVGYYFTAPAWEYLVERMIHGMRPGTVLLASHWLGSSPDHIQSGEAVHSALHHPLLQQTLHEHHEHRDGSFLLERWIRTAQPSRSTDGTLPS